MFASPGAIAFQIGPVVIRWYGILMATAIVVGLWLGHRQARREGLPADDIISAGQWAILAGLVGARAYEVIFNRDVRDCAYVATVGLSGSSGSSLPGEITVVGRAGAPNGVFITTHDSAGGPSDRGFHLAVHCKKDDDDD